jgi:hypothetical protein
MYTPCDEPIKNIPYCTTTWGASHMRQFMGAWRTTDATPMIFLELFQWGKLEFLTGDPVDSNGGVRKTYYFMIINFMTWKSIYN